MDSATNIVAGILFGVGFSQILRLKVLFAAFVIALFVLATAVDSFMPVFGIRALLVTVLTVSLAILSIPSIVKLAHASLDERRRHLGIGVIAILLGFVVRMIEKAIQG